MHLPSEVISVPKYLNVSTCFKCVMLQQLNYNYNNRYLVEYVVEVVAVIVVE
jgi:hypothetical protein